MMVNHWIWHPVLGNTQMILRVAHHSLRQHHPFSPIGSGHATTIIRKSGAGGKFTMGKVLRDHLLHPAAITTAIENCRIEYGETNLQAKLGN
jgi:non-canonical (house-cleaning) NTP pyrophosphatase